MKKMIADRVQKTKPSMTLAITAKAKELTGQGFDVVGFGAGEPDFDTPNPIKEAAKAAIDAGYTKYTPATGLLELKQGICDKLQRDNHLIYSTDEIIVNSGAKHSLSTAFQAILNPGDEVIIPVPYWVSYPDMIRIVDAVPIFVYTKEENHFKITPEELQHAITGKTKAFLLNSPSNPVGAVYSKEELKSIAEIAIKNNIYIVSDDIYEKLIYDDLRHYSVAQMGEEIKKLTILINGMSKEYAMTGWRLGYAVANSEVIKSMGRIQGHTVSHPSSITQYAGIAALKCDREIIKKMVKQYDLRRKKMMEKLDKMKALTYIYPQGAFYIFVNVSQLYGKTYYGRKINTSLELADVLLEEAKVALVPGVAFGLDTFVRLSYATSMDEIIKGLDRIESFIHEGV
ncbi:MAG: pyridoxal phosphate-dependent aminotransferase [Eubacteriales bacterium]